MSGFAQRKFDHDEARRRYAAGESMGALASEFGVSRNAVFRVVNARYAESQKRAREAYYERNRVPCEGCGKPCLAVHVGGKKVHNPDGRALCVRCRADEHLERIRFDDNAEIVAVRCNMLDCANGERWQPPENFARGTAHRNLRDGGIHSQCRACLTRARREYRHARRVPCVGCGTLVDHEHPRGDKPPECRTCANRRTGHERSRQAKARRERRTREHQHATKAR